MKRILTGTTLALLVFAVLCSRLLRGMTDTGDGGSDSFMAFVSQSDCERYCDTAFTSDSKAVKTLWDAGRARFMTDSASYTVLERRVHGKCVKIQEHDADGAVLYIAASVAARMKK